MKSKPPVYDEYDKAITESKGDISKLSEREKEYARQRFAKYSVVQLSILWVLSITWVCILEINLKRELAGEPLLEKKTNSQEQSNE